MKISKSACVGPTIDELSESSRIRALESERDYWKTRYNLLMKYGPHTIPEKDKENMEMDL